MSNHVRGNNNIASALFTLTSIATICINNTSEDQSNYKTYWHYQSVRQCGTEATSQWELTVFSTHSSSGSTATWKDGGNRSREFSDINRRNRGNDGKPHPSKPRATAQSSSPPRQKAFQPSKPSSKPSSSKRPHPDSTRDDPSEITLPGEEDGTLEIDQSCAQIRRKITAFLNSGAMKVTEFQRAIGVNSGPYGRFMKQTGPMGGCGNSTYDAAWMFFKKREVAGVKMPAKKRKTAGPKEAAADDALDVSGVGLDGEDDESVEIYDTCDEVRRKIAAHLRSPDVTQAAFLRALSTSFPGEKKLTSKQLKDFQGKKGPSAGNSSGVFYAAYVYFEKLRVKEGKAKGAKRKAMETKWAAEGGFHRKALGGLWCGPNDRPFEDKYGVVSVQKR